MTSHRELTKPWYGTSRWKSLRSQQLGNHPLCRMCLNAGMAVPATIADHVEPHKGDEHKFWNGELQSLCKYHHDSDKQRIEKGGKPKHRIGADGWPTEDRGV